MRCPVCKIDSMREVAAGKSRIDRCGSCGAAWFDPGEIRELAEGRFPGPGEIREGERIHPAGKGDVPGRMAAAWREAASISCPRCSRRLSAVDFRNTGVPVFRCRECGGTFAPRTAVRELARCFGIHRKNAALYDALGESLAEQTRRHMERQYGVGAGSGLTGDAAVPGLPVVVPLADAAAVPAVPPVATFGLLVLMTAVHILGQAGLGLPEGAAARFALPSGAGFRDAPAYSLWLAPFFHGGIVPLAVGCLFLYVLGDNVEGRLGRLPFLVFFLACGAIAGAAHIMWGETGAPAALGSAGAVAGVLGAYLVFFPEVPISMYGAGKMVSVPAYLFACAWVVALFLWGWGPEPLANFLNPAPYSIAGNLAGFGAGAAGAALWRSVEDRQA